MNWRTVSYEFDRWGRAVLTAIVFIVVMVGCVTLVSWVKQIEPFWLRLLLCFPVGAAVATALHLFFFRAPNRF